MKNLIGIVLGLVLGLAWNAQSQDFILTNGMAGDYLAAPGSGMAGIVAVVHVGVRNETAATNGISHYLEHLLFNGTRTLNQEQLYATFDELGVYANAQTGKDYTAFMIVGKATDLDTLFSLLREQLFFSTLPVDKFAKEKGIVEQEMLKDEQDDNYRFGTLFDLQAKRGTPYQFPTLGSRASISSITREQVLQYYSTWFHPNNVTLLVAADASLSEVLAAAQTQLEIVAPGNIPEPQKIAYAHPTRDRLIEIAALKAETNRFKATFPVSLLDSSQKQAAITTAIELFEPDSWLKDSPVQSLSFELFRDREFCLLEVSGEYQGTLDPASLRTGILNAFHQWQKNGLTNVALQRSLLRAKKDELKAAEQLQYWGLFRAQKLAIAPEEVWNRIDAERQKLKPADVVKAMEQTIASPVFLFIEKSNTLDATSNKSEIAIEDTTLANGVRIIARQCPGSELVGGHFLFANRSRREPAELHGIAEIAHSLLANGSTTIPSEKWQDTLAALGLEWKTADDPFIPYDNYYTTSEFSFVRFDVPMENLTASLSLLSNAIHNPRFDPERFEQTKKAAIGRAGRETGTARFLAQSELDKQLYGGDAPTSPYGSPMSLQAIDLSALQSFAKNYWNGANLIVTLDGPLAPETMIQAAVPALSTIEKGEALPKPERKVSLLKGDQRLKAGKSQSYLLLAGFSPSVDSISEEAVSIAGSILSNRVQQVLRETKGWAYNVGASASRLSGGTLITMSIGTRKELLDSAATAFQQVYREFLASAIPDSELTRTQHAIAGRNRMREAGRQYRAFRLGQAAYQGKALKDVFPGANRYDNVTAGEIRKAIASWPQEFMTITVE